MDDHARLGTGGISVFVLDDHALVRDALSDYIGTDPEMTVVGTAGTVEEALAGIAATRPSVAVLDVRLQDGSGLDVCREVRARHPEVACLLLTSHSEQEAFVAAQLAGAAGYLVKQLNGNALLEGIRTVARGGVLHGGTPTDDLRPRIDELCAGWALRLDADQRRVLEQAVGGSSNRQIADATNQSPATVRGQLVTIFQGLGLAG